MGDRRRREGARAARWAGVAAVVSEGVFLSGAAGAEPGATRPLREALDVVEGGCLSAEALAARIAGLRGTAEVDARLHVRVEERPRGAVVFSVKVAGQSSGGEYPVSVEEMSCTERIETVAEPLAWTIDELSREQEAPGAGGELPASAETRRPPVPPPQREALLVPPRSGGSPRWLSAPIGMGFTADSGVLLGSLPSATFMVASGVEVRVGDVLALRVGAFGTSQATMLAQLKGSEQTIRADMRLFAGRLDGCLTGVAGGLRLDGCIGIGAGWVDMASRGTPRRGGYEFQSATARLPWSAFAGRIQARWPSSGALGLMASLDGFASPEPPTFNAWCRPEPEAPCPARGPASRNLPSLGLSGCIGPSLIFW